MTEVLMAEKDETANIGLGYAYDSSTPDSYSDSSESESESDSSWDDDDSLLDIEERYNEFSVVGRSPALAAMVFNSELKLPRVNRNIDEMTTVSYDQAKMMDKTQIISLRKSLSEVFTPYDSDDSSTSSEESESSDCQVNPDEHLRVLLQERGIAMKSCKADSLNDFFLEMNAESMAAYDNNVASAARNGDLDALRRHAEAGKPLLCCNKFKESILHIICRRGHDDLLRYVLHETDTPINIQDEQGRTILHDAAWTHKPNFELIRLILSACPDLLYIEDQRGFTPLAYVGKQLWKDWCDFLDRNQEILSPKVLR